jgi:hypothetical protein
MSVPTIDKLAAAGGQLDMAPENALELLVALTEEEDSEVRRRAHTTIASWTEPQLRPLLRRRGASPDVLKYFLEPDRLRMELLPVLLNNRSTPPETMAELAETAGMEVIKIMLDNIGGLRTQALIALKSNKAYLSLYENRDSTADDGFVFEPSLLEMLIIEARLEDEREGNIGLSEEEIEEHDRAIAAAEAAGDEEKKQVSMYAKVAKMSVSQKVQAALKGGKEERSILIRDSSKVVSRAVLGSPKLTDSEVEMFSNAKNVSDEVLRMISMNRKFMKSYSVIKNLVNNPRTPLDVAMTWLSRLIITDIKTVSTNKNISETVRKQAMKMAKSKDGKGG